MAIDYAVLKAAILAETDAGFVAARDQGNNTLMARFYADAAVPTYYVWRSSYTPDQIAAAIEVGITQLDALTQSIDNSLRCGSIFCEKVAVSKHKI